MMQRQDGHWQTTQETSMSLVALTEFWALHLNVTAITLTRACQWERARYRQGHAGDIGNT